MRILYLSCHSILEQEEVSLLHELGHDVFSPGAYLDPNAPESATSRPPIEGLVYNPDILAKWARLESLHPEGVDGKGCLTQEVVDEFDCIMVMHIPEWISQNWPLIKNKRVIWRTIGQSITSVEAKMKPFREEGLEIVRYSPREARIPGYIGQSAMIRFYKDPEIYKDWNGGQPKVITFAQDMIARDKACNYQLFEHVTRPYTRELYGRGSESLSWGKGKVSFDRLRQEMRNTRVYFYTGTHPASYTLNFMEAWMTGCPIVAIGPRGGNASYFPDHFLYEIPDLLTNGINGFFSDNPVELRVFIEHLLYNPADAKKISMAARQDAIHHFGKETIKHSWDLYLGH